jgi:hypothetical protein
MRYATGLHAPGEALRQEVPLDQRLQDAHEPVVEVVKEVLVVADAEQDGWPVHPTVAPARRMGRSLVLSTFGFARR